MSFYVALFWTLLILTCSAALRWGGRAERWAAALFLCAAVATAAARHPWASRYQSVETGVLAIDLALLAGLAVIAYRTKPLWPIIAASLQAITTLAHFAKAVNPDFWRMAYAIMVNVSSYPTLVLLAIGTWQHRRPPHATAYPPSPPS